MKHSKKPKRSLAQQLMDLEEAIWKLHDAIGNQAQRAELKQQADRLSVESTRLIRKNLAASNRAYRKVAAALDEASDAATAGIDDVNAAQAAIDKLAAALDLVCQVAA
jgi:hypothetical protein